MIFSRIFSRVNLHRKSYIFTNLNEVTIIGYSTPVIFFDLLENLFLNLVKNPS